MKRKQKAPTRQKKRLNLFTSLLLLIFISVGSLLLAQQLQQRQIINSNAQTMCTTPGGCGGNCNPNQNNGCGYAGCRYWEYCADENGDGIPSCYDTTNLGKNLPDYSRACGTEKANKTSTGTNNTNTTVPSSSCNNSQGCGGNCNPGINAGCGYGGCRFWEYCGDDNNDGVPSCYDTTNLGKKEPDYSRACGKEKTSALNTQPPTSKPIATIIPTAKKTNTPIPTKTNAPTPTLTGAAIIPTSTSIPTNSTNTRTPTPKTSSPSPTIPTATPVANINVPSRIENLDMTKLCVPVEVHGSSADKMDLFIIPIGYKPEEIALFVKHSKLAVAQVHETNLSQYQTEVLNKMNWYLLNTLHADMPEAYRNRFIDFSEYVQFYSAVYKLCPRDRYVLLFNTNYMNPPGEAKLFQGLQYTAKNLESPKDYGFAHEWGHAVAGLFDEYDIGFYDNFGSETIGYNCAPDSSSLNPRVDPCPNSTTCNSTKDNAIYKKACPKWDCSKINCDPLQKKLFANVGCYPRCGSKTSFRPSAKSIMDLLHYGEGEKKPEFNGPSLYSIIKFVFGIYK